MSEGVNIFVAGQTGSGKSYFVKHSLGEAPRLIVYLPKREDCGYPGVYFDGMNGERWDFLHWWQWSKGRCNRFRLIYRPADKFNADEFDTLCRLVYACGDCVFVAEEIASYLQSRVFATVSRYQGVKNLLTAGRTRGVTCYWITQRPFGIPREVTSEARDAYLFRLQEPADLDYVQDRFGLAARLAIDKLGQYQYVHWVNTGRVEVGKVNGACQGDRPLAGPQTVDLPDRAERRGASGPGARDARQPAGEHADRGSAGEHSQ